MYQLSEKVLKIIKGNQSLRLKLAGAMGNGESAIIMDVRENKGKAIAKHYDAINRLLDETGLTLHDIRINEEPKKSKVK